jgi:hypothetical protein
MNRLQLEHVIRAAATIADDPEIVVIGSQAVLGQFPDAPGELLRSMEADVWPRHYPERWELIDGSIGELSPFHATFGYYAQGVGPETATLPEGWQDRLVRVEAGGGTDAVGLCLEIHDLVISKYAAGREKDFEFVRTAIVHGMVARETLLARLSGTPVDEALRERLAALIARDFAASG